MKKLAAMLLLDITLAAALAGGVYYVNYKMQRQLKPVGMLAVAESVPEVQAVQEESGAAPSGTATERENVQEENSAALPGNAEEEPEKAAVAGGWREKFAAHFTEEVQRSEGHYSSPSVALDIEEHSFGEGNDKVTYYLADVYIASIDCLRTKFAKNTYGVDYTDGLDVMAREVQAVAAVNGDSYSSDGRMENETLIRNGMLYSSGQNWQDMCVLYRDGEMRTYGGGQFDPAEVSTEEIWQTWNFGPALLDENGEIPSSYNTDDYLRESHPRTAVGYYEPGHYCLMVVDGRQENFSRGMYLEEMSAVFHDLGCRAAYNLDGGHCSFMTFGETIASHPYDYSDDISDCIYIAEP